MERILRILLLMVILSGGDCNRKLQRRYGGPSTYSSGGKNVYPTDTTANTYSSSGPTFSYDRPFGFPEGARFPFSGYTYQVPHQSPPIPPVKALYISKPYPDFVVRFKSPKYPAEVTVDTRRPIPTQSESYTSTDTGYETGGPSPFPMYGSGGPSTITSTDPGPAPVYEPSIPYKASIPIFGGTKMVSDDVIVGVNGGSSETPRQYDSIGPGPAPDVMVDYKPQSQSYDTYRDTESDIRNSRPDLSYSPSLFTSSEGAESPPGPPPGSILIVAEDDKKRPFSDDDNRDWKASSTPPFSPRIPLSNEPVYGVEQGVMRPYIPDPEEDMVVSSPEKDDKFNPMYIFGPVYFPKIQSGGIPYEQDTGASAPAAVGASSGKEKQATAPTNVSSSVEKKDFGPIFETDAPQLGPSVVDTNDQPTSTISTNTFKVDTQLSVAADTREDVEVHREVTAQTSTPVVTSTKITTEEVPKTTTETVTTSTESATTTTTPTVSVIPVVVTVAPSTNISVRNAIDRAETGAVTETATPVPVPEIKDDVVPVVPKNISTPVRSPSHDIEPSDLKPQTVVKDEEPKSSSETQSVETNVSSAEVGETDPVQENDDEDPGDDRPLYISKVIHGMPPPGYPGRPGFVPDIPYYAASFLPIRSGNDEDEEPSESTDNELRVGENEGKGTSAGKPSFFNLPKRKPSRRGDDEEEEEDQPRKIVIQAPPFIPMAPTGFMDDHMGPPHGNFPHRPQQFFDGHEEQGPPRFFHGDRPSDFHHGPNDFMNRPHPGPSDQFNEGFRGGGGGGGEHFGDSPRPNMQSNPQSRPPMQSFPQFQRPHQSQNPEPFIARPPLPSSHGNDVRTPSASVNPNSLFPGFIQTALQSPLSPNAGDFKDSHRHENDPTSNHAEEDGPRKNRPSPSHIDTTTVPSVLRTPGKTIPTPKVAPTSDPFRFEYNPKSTTPFSSQEELPRPSAYRQQGFRLKAKSGETTIAMGPPTTPTPSELSGFSISSRPSMTNTDAVVESPQSASTVAKTGTAPPPSTSPEARRPPVFSRRPGFKGYPKRNYIAPTTYHPSMTPIYAEEPTTPGTPAPEETKTTDSNQSTEVGALDNALVYESTSERVEPYGIENAADNDALVQVHESPEVPYGARISAKHRVS